MVRLVITHGRSQEFGIGKTMERDWADALRQGLDRARAPFAENIPIAFAFYGDLWRSDAGDFAPAERGGGERGESERGDDAPTDLQRAIASEMLAALPKAERTRAETERLGWDTLATLVGNLDGKLGVGSVALRIFLQDIDRYFADETLRDDAIGRLTDAIGNSDEPVVLMAHSLGTIIAYDALRRHGDLPVPGFVTFGSPLGLATVRKKLEETGGPLDYPPSVRRWANIFEKRDFVPAGIKLAGYYEAGDGRTVDDEVSKGKRPSAGNLVAAHDAIVYLSSAALAKATRAIVEAVQPATSGGTRGGAERDSERSWDLDFGAESAMAGDEERGGDWETVATDDAERGGGGGDWAAAFDDGGGRSTTRGIPSGGRRSATRGIPRDAMADLPEMPIEETAAAAPPPKPAPATAATQQMKTVEREAAASFPPFVAAGSETRLTFSIGKKPKGRSRTTLSVEVPVDQETLDLNVMVQAPYFEVIDPADGVVPVSLDLTNARAHAEGSFLLRAADTGKRLDSTIRLRFLNGTNQIGAISLDTVIASSAADANEEPVAAVGSLRQRPDEPPGAELSLFVISDRNGGYEITAALVGGRGPNIARKVLGTFPVTGEAWKYAQDVLEKYRLSRDLSAEDRRERVDNLGLDLWRKLPDDFHEFYWKNVHKNVSTILIYSQEPYIPWELIKPERSPGGTTAKMLGEQYAMARWDDDRPQPRPIVVSDFAVVAPAYPNEPLDQAAAEAGDLEREFGARRYDPGSRAQVMKLLKARSLQVLHFSGHGKFPGVPTKGAILLADKVLDIVDVNSAKFAKQKQPPLVFLNACEVGNQGWSLTQIGGWAEAFCSMGSTGFVGPYWAVNDRVARKAALVFYESLRDGKTVGEAMQAVRAQYGTDKEDRYHPTWLAYSLHCHPNVTVQFAGA